MFQTDPTFRRQTLAALLAATALSSVPATAAWAAEGEGDAADAEVEELIVTARRRDESAQSVPVAISAYSGESLEQRRATNVRDLQQLAPSLVVTVTNPRNTSINIRGLGNNVSVYNDGLQPAVGVYLDQVYLGRPGQAVFDLGDIDSVQVLRGPQGTLFGKNTSAGAVVIGTRAPAWENSFTADVSGGNYEYFQAHATANAVLLEDRLALRVSLANTQRTGFMRNVFDGERTQDYHDFGGRVQLLATPNDALSVRIIADYGQQYSNTSATVLTGLFTNYADDSAAYPNGYLARAARVGFTPLPINPEARRVSTNTKNNYFEYHGGLAVIADWEIPGHVLTSVTSYRFWNWYPHNDADGTTASAAIDFHQENEQQQFSQELRLASAGERSFDYVVGLHWFWQDIEAEAINRYGPAGANWFLAPAAGSAAARSAALDDYFIVSHSSPETRSAAIFAQGSWRPIERLELTAGLRYTWEEITGYFDQTATGRDLSALSPADRATAQALRARFGVANYFETETSDTALTGQLTASWTFRPGLLTYVTYSRGYKAGGVNLSNINTAGASAVDPVIGPETIDAYEAGLKSSWFDRRLVANVALFWTKDDNYQTTQVNLINNVSSLTNAGEVRSRGVEVDLQAAPAEWLSLYGSVTYNAADYVSYKQASCPIEIHLRTVCDLSDRRLPGVSLWAVSAGGEAHWPAGQIGGGEAEFYVGGDYSYRSNFYTTASLSSYSLIPEYDIVNLRAGFRAADGRWDVQAWSRNLGDETYFLTLAAGNTGAVAGTLGDPRTFGVTLRLRP